MEGSTAVESKPILEARHSIKKNSSLGEAAIKLEFINDKPKEVAEFLPKKVADDLEASNDTEEPPKKKLKGRNKRRPREPKVLDQNKLCPQVIREKECRFGEKCKFFHDVKAFMLNKPEDLGTDCPAFNTYGKCSYSLSCRFASKHVSEDFKNVINEDLFAKFRDTDLAKNVLAKDLQMKLRKRNYDFKKALDIVREVQNPKRSAAESDIENSELKEIRLPNREKKTVDFRDKLYLAPLTTVGNLPFRKVCKLYGADITCGEMAISTQLLQASASEWALVRRDPVEDLFGVQICGAYPDSMTKTAQLLCEETDIDFIDINCGCPIDLVYQKGEGCALMARTARFEQIIKSMKQVMDLPLTVKIRTGIYDNRNIAHTLVPKLKEWGVSMVTLHGRSREQRYTRLADWSYINECSQLADPMPLFGNGDVMSFEDYNEHRTNTSVAGTMIARGALIKPWVFTEIKEQRHWDISSSERLQMLRDFTNTGLMHWGSDTQGVATTRRFLLEWLSFLHRYIPVGVLERVPQKINERPPSYFGRDDLETLMASSNCGDWIKISEMLLGPVPDGFSFLPKHKANSYQ